MSQLAIDGTGTPTPPETRLTERQRSALEKIAAGGPVPSEDLGAHLNPDYPESPWNRGNGAAMGSRLRELGLVRYSRKHGGWMLRDAPDPRPVDVGPDDEIPF